MLLNRIILIFLDTKNLSIESEPLVSERIGTAKRKEKDADGKGYKRNVGMKGSKLSGGQKQRVAIARTVIRRPKIYMFDEATSALDTESEKIVQDALDKISQQSTSISIAHRISTIKNSDVIFVAKDGFIVEQGTYDQLMEKQGEFYQINSNV